MSKYRSFDEWWYNSAHDIYNQLHKNIAEDAYEAAVDKVLEEVFDEVQYQYSTNISDEIITVIKKSMENKDE